MPTVEQGASIVVNEWLHIKSGNTLTILTDESCRAQAELLAAAARKVGAEEKLLLLPVEREQAAAILGAEPYASALDTSEFIIGATRYSLITSKKISTVTAAGRRYLSLPLSANDGKPMLGFDFMAMSPVRVREIARGILAHMENCREIRVTTPAGTDLTLDIRGRRANFFSGDFSNGTRCDSSCFEAYIAPVETGTNGVMAVDGSFGYIGAPEKPLRIEFKNGRAVSIENSADGERLRAYIASFRDGNMLVAAEFGLGLNLFGRCTGNCYIEDESAFGTFHIGMGRNLTLGGQSDAAGHYDLVCFRPTVFMDGTILMKDGILIED
ncbi:MAG: peptidase [Clostridiaceae bacterium]|nr:aminopeptidase [Eubacteriales bacterium]